MTTSLQAVVWFLLCSWSQAELVLVYSINRHGARNVLSKNANLSESAAFGGPALLPAGIRLCYNAGAAFHQRYINDSSCGGAGTCLVEPQDGDEYGVIGTPRVSYTNYDVLVRSSALDRAIVSARAFLSGVFPPVVTGPNAPNDTTGLPNGQQLVPVYTEADTEDLLVRAYTKCPTYQYRLEQFFRTAEFKAKEQESAELRAQVARLWPGQDTSLQLWWNVYDGINVWKTYRIGNPPPFNVDDPALQQLIQNVTSLASWLETTKMRSSLTGNMLGGVLLSDVVQRMVAATEAVHANQKVYYKLLVVSSHYNTQLGLLSALSLDKYSAASNLTWFKTIPRLASLLAFELHRLQDGDYGVRAVMQDGPSAPYLPIPLPCAAAGNPAEQQLGPGACLLNSFFQLAVAPSINSTAEWCDVCDNTEVQACRVRALQRVQHRGGNGVAWKVAVGCVVTGLCTLGLCYALHLLLFMGEQRRRKVPSAAEVRLNELGDSAAMPKSTAAAQPQI